MTAGESIPGSDDEKMTMTPRMQLHWSPRSPFVRKVMVFAHEAQLADTIEPVRSPVAMTAPNRDLMRINPIAKIPTLVTDEGTVIPDSLAIIDFLDTRHAGPRFIPTEGSARVQALRWHSIANGLIEALVLWRNERVRPAGQISAELIAAFETKLAATLAWLEHDLPALRASEHATAATRGLATIGHVTIACALGYIDYRFSDIDWRRAHPGLAEWFAPIDQRPSMLSTRPED